MKCKFRILLSSLIITCLYLINITLGVPLYSYAEAYTYDGLLLDSYFLVEGAENLTKNEDGTWTATGDFTVKCPVDFDPYVQRYSFAWEVISSDGTYDFDISFYSSDTETTTIALWEGYYGAYSGIKGSYTGYEDLAAIYEVYQKRNGWYTSDNHVKCDTITFRAKTATTTTFTYLGTSIIPKDLPTFDINGDGQVSTSDVREMLLYVVGNHNTKQVNMDIDQNGEINTKDARVLLVELIQS